MVKYVYDGVSLQNDRPTNMDSLLLKAGRIHEQDALLVVVCDGVGSLSDGAFASGTAVKLLGEWFSSVTHTDRIGLRMRDAIVDINAYIVREARQRKLQTATTLSALLLVDDTYCIAHVGDSRVYSFANDTLTLLTNDDVSEAGKLTAYIGQTENIVLHYTEGLARGKTFVLCTDGLHKRMDTHLLTAKLKFINKRMLKEVMAALVHDVITRGERDNISLAVVKIES